MEKSVQTPEEDFEVMTAKLVTWDALPNDPGHIEIDSSYSLMGGGKYWATNGNLNRRANLKNHSFDESFYVGVVKDVDVFIGTGYSILTDKDNNYDEVKGLIDPDTDEEMEDPTEGPHHGFGIKDLTTGARWRFYNNESKELSFAYVPQAQIPIGRRSNFDHLGPSQRFTSMDNRLVMTKNFGRFNTNTNLAYSTPFAQMEKTENYCGTLNANFAVGYQLTKWLHPEVEAIYNHLFEKYGKGGKVFTMVFGFIVPVSSHVRLDTGLFQDVLGSGVDQTTTGYFRLVFTA